MYFADANGPDCWTCSLKVEWHDCSWCPAIVQRRGIEFRSGAAARPLPAPALLPNAVRRKNFPKPMKKIENRKSKIENSRAFTLVELLTVIAIIGILAGMLLPVLASAKKHALILRAKTEISGLVTAIEAYDSDYGRFPVSPTEQAAAYLNGNNDFTCGYVKYPQDPNTALLWPGTPAWAYDNNSNVVAILMDLTAYPTYPTATPTPANSLHQKNPKQVKYLNAKLSGYNPGGPGNGQQNPPGGVDNTGVYRDPWGNPYIITMDLSYDDQCNDIFYSLKNVSQSSGQAGYNGLVNTNSINPNTDTFLYHGKVMVWSAGPDGKVDPTLNANTPPNKDNILSWQ